MIEHLIPSAAVACVFIIAGSGMYILSRLCGQVSFVSATYMAVAGAICSYFSRSKIESTAVLEGRNFTFMTSFFIAVGITSAASVLFGLITFKMRHGQSLLISISVSAVVIYSLQRLKFLVGENGFVNASRDLSVGGNDFANLKLGSHTFSRDAGLLILAMFLTLAVMFYTKNVCRSPFSRSMRTLSSGEKFSQACAISTFRTVIGAHLLSGIFFGVAGALIPYISGSIEISSVSLWAGTFGLLLSAQLLILVNVSISKNYWIICAVIGVLAGGGALLAQSSQYVDGIVNDSGAKITSLQIIAFVTSLILVISMNLHARSLKSES